MCSGVGSRVLLGWVSPFGNPRINARLPAPRGLSQAPTSFIGSWYQDIHRLPLVACHKNKQQKAKLRYKEMLASTIQFSKYGQEHQPRTTTYQKNPSPRETTHPENKPTSSLMRAGPSHPTNQKPRLTSDPRRNSPKTLYESRARFLRTQQRASATPLTVTHVPRLHPKGLQQY